jgi:hypothetical protein
MPKPTRRDRTADIQTALSATRKCGVPPKAWTLTVVLIVMVWMFVLTWYLMWGLWLVPYRILRRGQRKQKAEQRRHREMIERLDGGP